MALHSLRDIKRRIRSVQNTQQITKAMEMVSAAKLRRAQNVVTSGRPYDDLLRQTVGELASSMETVPHPYFQQREVRASALVVVTSDKGLCGAFNSNLVRQAEAFMRDRAECRLVLLGKRGNDYFVRRRRADIVYKRTDLGGRIDHATAKEIAREVGGLFLSGDVDEVYLMYTKSISTMRRSIVTDKFLPVGKAVSRERAPEEGGVLNKDFILEPGPEEMLEHLMPGYAASRIYMALAENFASEHAARMIAMSAATKNAGEMIDYLILTRNRVRQAAITKELSEIVGCIEALKYV
jgi:F-type H+-transporting ATPase subunit gamma